MKHIQSATDAIYDRSNADMPLEPKKEAGLRHQQAAKPSRPVHALILRFPTCLDLHQDLRQSNPEEDVREMTLQARMPRMNRVHRQVRSRARLIRL